MSIRRGQDWGEAAPPPDSLAVFDSDADAAAAIATARRANQPLPALGLAGGDLHRTLGGTPGRDPSSSSTATRVRVDLGACLVDGALHWFLAHVVARRRGWSGSFLVVANAAFMGTGNIAPRAHPGDGRFDLLEGSLSASDRLKAWRRLGSGTHVPHPRIETRRVEHLQRDFDRAMPIHLDGQLLGSARTLSVRIESEAVEVWL